MIPKLAVIILNYHRPLDTIECVESVLAAKNDNFSLQVVLVDNSEGNESYQLLHVRYPEIPLLHNENNLGYAEGNNVGIRFALEHSADYVFILNNDCVVEKNALNALIQYAAEFPDAGILAPLVCRYDDRTTVDSCGTSMDWFRLRPRGVCYQTRNDEQLPEVIEVQIIPGSALLLGKKFLSRVGLFDADYFLIHEDADLCLRSLKHGYKNKVLTTAVVYHKISGTFSSYPGFSIYYTIRNFLRLSAAHNSLRLRLVVHVGLLLLSMKKWVTLIGNKANRFKQRCFFLGVWDYFTGKKGACSYEL